MRKNAGFKIIKAETYKIDMDDRIFQIVLGKKTWEYYGITEWATWECIDGCYSEEHCTINETIALIDYHKRLINHYEEAPF